MSESPLRRAIVEDGYTIVRDVVGQAELVAIQSELLGLIDVFYRGQTTSPDFWNYSVPDRAAPILYRIHNLEKQPGCPAVQRLFADGALHEIASTCLGQPAAPTVRAAVVKLPEVGAPVPWHRDRSHDEVAPGQAVNLSLYLHDSTETNGCLQVAPGSQGLGKDVDPEEWRRAHEVTDVLAGAGDVTVHDVRIVHGSGPNSDDSLCVRIVMEFRAESLPADVLLQET